MSENKGLFQNMTEKQIEKAVREAYRYAKTIERQGPRVRAQGPGPSPAYVIEMWINLETKVMETAYPVFR